MTEPRERARAMIERVAMEARAVLSAADADRVRAAIALSLAFRDRLVADDHDPRYLHPARTIRILIADAGCADATALAAAAFHDTIDTGLVPDPPPDLHAFLAGLPAPHEPADRLLETLVSAEPGAAVVALAESLDHARHAHLRPDIDRDATLAAVRHAYIPAARRLAPLIARRFERWADAFERRRILPL
jgi:hypothetical protein